MKAVTVEATKAIATSLQLSSTSPALSCLSRAYALAAYIVGMPTRNENSVAASRSLVPESMAAKIVAPERDVPGNTPAMICATPTMMATGQLTCELFGLRAASHSAAIIQKPPMISAQATGAMVSG